MLGIEVAVVGTDEPALIDPEQTHLAQHRWRLDRDGYVMRKTKGRRIYLHHLILPGKRYPQFVRDHINRNKLDNRSSNLRWLTLAESAQNKGPYRRSKNTLTQRGVVPMDTGFRAQATLNGKQHNLGLYESAEIAAQVAAEWRCTHMPFATP